ncbi:MAG: hypothetical protein ACT443_08280 [Gemmatimonadota bacterium]
MITKRRLVALAALGVLAASSGAAVVFRLNGQSAAPHLAIPVEGDAVIRDTLVLAVSAAGQAAPWREAVITARGAGQVQSVARAENATVGADASLASIRPLSPRTH